MASFLPQDSKSPGSLTGLAGTN